ncbi:MAG: phytoene desaturase family protein [Actinomycetes bacterium]
MTDAADVVVVGGGHNALVCAAYLAEAGLEVVVLEARDVLGGDTVTEELTLPGWRHDSCASAHVVLQSNPLVRDDELGLLSRYGLRYVHTDPAFVMPLEDDAVVVHRDLDATAAELGRWSPEDAVALQRMMAEWSDGLGAAHARWSAGLPPGEDDASRRYEALRSRSAWEVVHATFTHPVARAFATWLAFATIQPPERPGTGALPAALTNGRLTYGWTTPVGGSGALPSALAAHLADHGGRVLTEAEVSCLVTASARVTGVRTVDGRVFHARSAVVSSAHLASLPAMLDPVPDDVARAASAWRPGLALFAVHLALRGDVRYRGRDGPLRAAAGALGSPEGLRRQVSGCLAGRAEVDDPWLLVASPTPVDPGRAPDGGGIAKLLTPAPARLTRGRAWSEDTTEAYAECLIAHVRERVDGLDPDDVLGVVAESPDGLARRNPHNLEGSCHGGEFDLGARGVLPGWPSPRTSVPGLYLTGATTHPGGSVSGRPGRNSARCVLGDLGIDPETVMAGYT